MNKLRIGIVADSACDLPKKIIEQYKISIVPHQIILHEKPYKVGVDLDLKEYYAILNRQEEIPESTTPSAEDFYESFKRQFDEGAEHIIYVSVSSHLTSTLQMARVAAKKFPEKVSIIDSYSASGVQGLLILAIIQMIEQNYQLQQILEKIDALRSESILVVGFHTLDNVYKSGRLKSKLLLKLTKLMGIKPVAQMLSPPGILKSAFPGLLTTKNMEKRLVTLILKSANRSKTYNIIVSHVENEEGAKRIVKQLKEKITLQDMYITEASPIIGTNTGKNTIIVSLLPTID